MNEDENLRWSYEYISIEMRYICGWIMIGLQLHRLTNDPLDVEYKMKRDTDNGQKQIRH